MNDISNVRKPVIRRLKTMILYRPKFIHSTLVIDIAILILAFIFCTHCCVVTIIVHFLVYNLSS